ncbi:MAG: glycoside hydrolase family 3 C-terminal domain-containing protein, partial [Lachnospiraceae bacterium]|nr:glycoside hydrolase family 3 C-terminal domain-containing protein [Lachnospiraceae bacterium]
MKNIEKENERLVTGFGAWHIGDIHVSDGPHGMRTQDDGADNNESYEATCFPTASSMACSWNREAAAKMAKGIAAEAKELGVSVVLGPGVNIKRSPLCGRNFEYYSEDPFLAGEMVAEYIRSMQDCGVGTSLKHFACNSQETHRMTSNSMVDERALREIYLAAFEIAVKKADPSTIMASYNFLNGQSACENRHLLTEILRDEWGYEGLVMSDWGACVDLPACIEAGMDVEMPDSNGVHEEDLKEALKTGSLSKEALDKAVKRIKELNERYKDLILPEGSKKGVTESTRNANHELAASLEAENAVLLKNDSFLPLKEGTKVLMIGGLAEKPRIQGGGSSHINTKKIDGFIESFEKNGLEVTFVKGYSCDSNEPDASLENEALAKVKEAVKDHITILFFGGLTEMAEGEGYDRRSFDLPGNQSSLLKKIYEITDDMAFISFSGSPYKMELPVKSRALLQMYLGGEAVADACAKIVTGKINPSGKLAETYPLSEKDVPCRDHFGRENKTLFDVEYRESIFVGYRYYDTYDIPVRFCFGHGLSYTEFEYSALKTEKISGGEVKVSFSVENTGKTAGKEVCEVYVRNPENGDFRAKRELRGFTKLYLESGEKREVSVTLNDRAFSVFQNGTFSVIGGEYEIQVGASLNDIRLKESIE